MLKKMILPVLAAVALSGCDFSRQDYRLAAPELHLVTNNRLSVGVQDHRPYIIDHDKEENFVGIQRGGFGIPVSLVTQSILPLAEDMTSGIVKSLVSKGITATSMKITPNDDLSSILRLAHSQRSDKIILLTLKNWKTDAYQSTDLIYDIEMKVIDINGHELAEKHLQGTDNLGRSILSPLSVAIEKAPKAFQKKIEELFSADIIAALSSKPF